MAKEKKDIFKSLLGGAVVQKEDMESVIKDKIVIMPELKNLIPPLASDEYGQLKENIKTEGCRDALIVWKKESGEYILVDGHNRYGICIELGIDYKVEEKAFADIEEAKDWMINNQLGKRNITEEVKSYLEVPNMEGKKIGMGEQEINQKFLVTH